jgi:hypothetical protein
MARKNPTVEEKFEKIKVEITECDVNSIFLPQKNLGANSKVK